MVIGLGGWVIVKVVGIVFLCGFLFNEKFPFFGEIAPKSCQGTSRGRGVVEDGLIPMKPGTP